MEFWTNWHWLMPELTKPIKKNKQTGRMTASSYTFVFVREDSKGCCEVHNHVFIDFIP